MGTCLHTNRLVFVGVRAVLSSASAHITTLFTQTPGQSRAACCGICGQKYRNPLIGNCTLCSCVHVLETRRPAALFFYRRALRMRNRRLWLRVCVLACVVGKHETARPYEFRRIMCDVRGIWLLCASRRCWRYRVLIITYTGECVHVFCAALFYRRHRRRDAVNN